MLLQVSEVFPLNFPLYFQFLPPRVSAQYHKTLYALAFLQLISIACFLALAGLAVGEWWSFPAALLQA